MSKDPRKRVGLEATYFRVKSKEILHLQNLYKMMHEWLVEEEYCDDNEHFPETYYIEKRFGGKRRIYILWRAEKEPEYNPFYTRHMDVLFKCEHVQDIEVMQGGKKFATNKGEVEVKCWGFMEVDAKGEWRKNWFLKHFLDIYWQRIFYRDFEVHKQEVIRDVEGFRASINHFLNLLTYRTD